MSVQVSSNATCSETLSGLRRAFLEGLASRGESERNVAAHGLGVDRFAEYLSPRPPEDAIPSDLGSFLSYLSELGVTAVSLKTYRTVVQHWLAYLEDHRRQDEAAAADSGSIETVTEEPAPSPSVAAFMDAPADGEGDSSNLLLSDLEAPGCAETSADQDRGTSVARCEPEPTTPMMPVVASPIVETGGLAGGFEPVASDSSFGASRSAPGFEAIESPEAAVFEPLDPEPTTPELPAVAVPPEFEPMAPEPEPGGFEPAGGEPAVETIEPTASSFLDAPEAPLTSFETPGFEPSEEELSAPDGGFSMIEPEDESVAVPAFGAPSESLASSVLLPDENAAAETRDKAKLQAPPLPSLEKAPAAPIPGDTEFDGPAASIPLVGPSEASSPSLGDSTQRGEGPAGARAPAVDLTGGEMQTQPGTGKWGLRRPQGERRDLSLDAIITMAVTGDLGAEDLVRKPSGEWVSAGELRPLRRALGLDGGPSAAVRCVRAELALGRAAAGMVVAGLASGLLWWFTTLAVGVELVPLAILGGLLGGLGARAAAGRAAPMVGLVGAAAAPVSVLVGRYLVYETVSSGVALEGLQDVGGFGSFLGSGLGTTQLVCLGLGALAGLLMGSVGNR